MLSKTIIGFVGGILLTGGAWAATYEDASAEDLVTAAIAAVDAADADTLLTVMQVMQERSMFFFEGDESLCRREPPKVGLLAKPGFNFGTARTAYRTFNIAQRVEEQNCACPGQLRSFAEFSVLFLGVMPEDISEADMAKLREYNIKNKNAVADAYRNFRNGNCREEF